MCALAFFTEFETSALIHSVRGGTLGFAVHGVCSCLIPALPTAGTGHGACVAPEETITMGLTDSTSWE